MVDLFLHFFFYNGVSVSRSVVPDSLQPHGLQLTRLLGPWDFPGNDTGVGCHFLLQGSSQPRDQTQVSCIAGGFFTNWAIREAIQFSSVQSLSRVWLFVTPWITAHQASLSITNSRSSPRLTSIDSVMPSSHLILCRPLLLLPPIPPSIRIFSNESTLCMRWPLDGTK